MAAAARQTMERIELFFDPRTVALIGATDAEGATARAILDNLLIAKDRLTVYPINPERDMLLGLQCYPTIGSLPEPPDLAIIVAPAESIVDMVEESGRAGVKAAVVVSADSGETSALDLKSEHRISDIAAKHNVRVMGPDCMGVIRPSARLNTTPIQRMPKPGNVAFLSQSSALGSGVLDWAISKNIGFSAFVSLGSMLDVDFGDLIDHFGEDPETRSIIIYLESIRNARKFMSAARGFARTKPIIVLKPGKFGQPAEGAESHTGFMVGEDLFYDAIFRRAGAIRVEQIEDLFNCASILNAAQLPHGPNLLIVANAAGPAVLAKDTLLTRGGSLAELSEPTVSALNDILPAGWSKSNPIQVPGHVDPLMYAKTIEVAVKDPGVNAAVLIFAPQRGTNPIDLAKAVSKQATKSRKPILAALIGDEEVAKARRLLYDNMVPTYEFPEDAIRTYLYMYEYARNLENLYETPEELAIETGAPKNHLKTLIRKAVSEGRTLLDQRDSRKFLTTYRIDSLAPLLAKGPEDAARLALDIGYPVAMKIASPDIIRKSDVGGVKLNVSSAQAVRTAFDDIVKSVRERSPGASIDGVSIQKMVTDYDYEFILGSKKDAVFGPVIMFGLGGAEAEFLREIAVGLPPLNQVLARRLLQQTRVYDLLSHGFKTKPPVNLRLVDETLVRLSNLIIDFPEVKEVDINPLVVTATSAVALDARIVLDKETVQKGIPEYGHLIITPYPTRYVQPWTTKDGRSVLLRPIRPEDEPLERALIAGLSQDSMRFRFFYTIKEITHDMLTRFCNIDYDREMAIIAEYTSNGTRRNVGVGRLVIRPERDTGEFATLVADDFQDTGLGLKLTDMLIGIAQEKGLQSIYGIVLADNVKMLNLARRLGFTVERPSGGETRVTLRL